MTDFIIKKLPYDLSSHAGLAFIGKYLKRVNVNSLIDPKFPVRSGASNSDILKSYLALLCLGKSDFDAIESFLSIPVNVTADSGNVTGIPANVTGGRCCAF